MIISELYYYLKLIKGGFFKLNKVSDKKVVDFY